MNYTGKVYRHPMEAYTPLLEVTIGCSHNKCAFCTMYRETPFRISPLEHIKEAGFRYDALLMLGVGKTSIYKSIYYNENKDEKRINTDEIVARIGSWQDNNLQMKCAKEFENGY